MLCQKFDERVVCSMNYINKQKKIIKRTPKISIKLYWGRSGGQN